MPTRRQVLRGAGATAVAAAGAAVLPGLATSAFAQVPQQSPINIVIRDVERPRNAAPLRISYPTSVDLEVEHTSRDTCGVSGHEETIEASHFSTQPTVTINGQAYNLLQFHFHIRSEHTLAGVRFAMEQHFVHSRVSDGALLVLGLWLARDGGGTPQDQVLSQIPVECGTPVHHSGVNLRGMLPNDLHTYAYPGSLTTSPFDEGVSWHMLRTPKRIANSTILQFHDVWPGPTGNSRAVQPINGRTVTLTPGQLV